MADHGFDLSRFPVHVGSGGRVVRLPEHDGSMAWYGRYGADFGDEGDEGRLVTMHTFSESWDMWEAHPTARSWCCACRDR